MVTFIEWLDSGSPVALELVGGNDGVAVLSFDIDPGRREALLTLVRGLHGVPTPETISVLAVA